MPQQSTQPTSAPLSEPTVTDQREVMERGVNSTICRGFAG